MISVKAAKNFVLNSVPTTICKSIHLDEALGYYLAGEILAPVDLPNFNNSAMDGYGMCFSEILKGVRKFRLVTEIKAGDTLSEAITEDTTCSIYTGAIVPPSVDVIIPIEHTNAEGGFVEILDYTITQHQHIRRQGEQIKQGEIALQKGHLINAASIGFLAALGISQLTVFSKPKIAIITTGNELVEIGNSLQTGQIFNSNKHSLKALVKSSDIDQCELFHTEDTYEGTYTVFKNALINFDIIISTGGVSVGKYDLVNDVLTDLGVKKQFHKVNQKPGKPIYFGCKDSKLVFGLPGNPAAVITSFYQYVLPAIKKWCGNPLPFLETEKAILAHDIKVKGTRTKFLKAIVTNKNVTILEGQGSHILQSMALSNCIVEIQPEEMELEKGTEVLIHKLPNV